MLASLPALALVANGPLAGLPFAALAIGGSVLAICTLLMSQALSNTSNWRVRSRPPSARRRVPRSTSGTRVEISYERPAAAPWPRRGVTGARPSMNALPPAVLAPQPRRLVTGPARQADDVPDVLSTNVDVVAAERTIEYLLEADPDALAGIIMQWLDEDGTADDQSNDAGFSTLDSSTRRRR